jgi:hypothetical protein
MEQGMTERGTNENFRNDKENIDDYWSWVGFFAGC